MGSIRSPHGSLRADPFRHALFSAEGRAVMPTYRAYLINAENRVSSYRAIDADSDAEALKAAHQFVDGCDVEVWDLDRKVGRLKRRRR
jgi:hypothetical protein